MAELQALLDEWIVAVWQNRPHDGLRDPLAPGRALTPNERYAALIDAAGYVPVPLSPEDYIELLPADWRVINSYGVKIGLRTYDSGELNPYRRQHSGIEAQKRPVGGPVRPLRHLPDLDPQPPPRRLAARDLEAPAHGPGAVRRAGLEPRPAAAGRPRQRPRHRGRDRRGGRGPARPRRQGPRARPGEQASPQQDQAAARTRSPRSRRVRGRTAATAAPQWPRPAPGPATATRTPPGRPMARPGSRPRPKPRPRRRR